MIQNNFIKYLFFHYWRSCRIR